MMLDALNLDQLRVFVTIADQGSFSAAARHLRRAQSAVSNAIANLEGALGVVLFDRGDWKPRLTSHGRALLLDARAVLERTDQLRSRARGLGQGLEPELSLVIDVMFPIADLVKLVTGFQEAFPGVALRLRTEILGGVPEMVLTGQYNLGIQGSFPDVAPDLVSHMLPEIVLEPVAAPNHPLAGERKISRDLLREHSQIVLTDHSKRTDGRTFSVYADQRILTTDLGSKQAMLRAGLGWGFMPLSVVEEDLKTAQLIELDLADRPPRSRKMPLILIYRRGQPPGPAGRWVIDTLLNRSK